MEKIAKNPHERTFDKKITAYGIWLGTHDIFIMTLKLNFGQTQLITIYRPQYFLVNLKFVDATFPSCYQMVLVQISANNSGGTKKE